MIGTQFETKSGTYTITCLLGKGKSGHTYLMERHTIHGPEERVVKIMYDETVPFYSFRRERFEAEVDAYHTLQPHGIHMPELLEYDVKRRYLVKSYVDGRTAAALVADGLLDDAILAQLFEMAARVETAGINIDYFPTNFVVTPAGDLYYIDYEVNPLQRRLEPGELGHLLLGQPAGHAPLPAKRGCRLHQPGPDLRRADQEGAGSRGRAPVRRLRRAAGSAKTFAGPPL